METAEGNTNKRVCTFPPPNFAHLLLQRLLQILIGEHLLLQLLPQGTNVAQLGRQAVDTAQDKTPGILKQIGLCFKMQNPASLPLIFMSFLGCFFSVYKSKYIFIIENVKYKRKV